METTCPVCNKAGLKDYTRSPIICPQCNSDLKAFMILHSINKRRSLNTYGVILLFIIIGVLAFFVSRSVLEKKQIIKDNVIAVSKLSDSIQIITQKTANNEQVVLNKKSATALEIPIMYTVRKGDCPAKIAEYFYNNWKMYAKIESDNNLIKPYILKPGQKLLINIKQE